MILSKLNGIAARIAIAIVAAIILGLLMAIGFSIGLGSYVFRDNRSPYAISHRVVMISFVAHRNVVMLSAEIAMTIRAAASMPRPERKKIIALIADPDIPVTFDAPVPLEDDAGTDFSLDRFRRLVQVQLDDLAPQIVVSARRLPVQTGQPRPCL